MSLLKERLSEQSVAKSFFQYFIPTLLGMMLMSINIVVDGIFVGNGIGSVALASVNIAVPVFTLIISISLLIGVGGGTLYSMAMGEGKVDRAKQIFTTSTVLVTIVTLVIGVISYVKMESLALLFGANEETLPYVIDYIKILLLFSLFIGWETCLSIFVRNDGNPMLAMVGLVVAAMINIFLNYWMIFVWNLEVTGAALATAIATIVGLIILMTHFFKKGSGLMFVPLTWNRKDIRSIHLIGFPSFLSEAGMGVFVVGYNIAMGHYVGTKGLAAFSVINYLHTFMFLAFIGIGASIQPMISYYYGAKKYHLIKKTVNIAEVSALVLGGLFITVGYFGADFLVSIFGISSEEIRSLAINGIQLFFPGYLFMGINFIYMTYYQSIGSVRSSLGITIFRGFILLIACLYVLPMWWGVNGIWLAVPVAEGIVAMVLLLFARKGVIQHGVTSRGF